MSFCLMKMPEYSVKALMTPIHRAEKSTLQLFTQLAHHHKLGVNWWKHTRAHTYAHKQIKSQYLQCFDTNCLTWQVCLCCCMSAALSSTHTTTHASQPGFMRLWHHSRVSLPTNQFNSLPRLFSEPKNVKNVTDTTLCFYFLDMSMFQCNHTVLLISKSSYSTMSK